jgi:hypothetical protein
MEFFDFSIEPKQTEDQPKQFDMEHILAFFQEILDFSVFFSVFFGLFLNSLFRFYTETQSFDVSIEPKQIEDQPKQFDREHIFGIFMKILGCFGFFHFVSKQFCLF